VLYAICGKMARRWEVSGPLRPHWTLVAEVLGGSGRGPSRPQSTDPSGPSCTPVEAAYFDRAVLLRLQFHSKAREEGKSPTTLLAKQYGIQLLTGIYSDLSGSRLWGHGSSRQSPPFAILLNDLVH
jgi:hypothetical protein